jgi:hypothetical protein
MRCEECGREVRPVVALDIDGTLGDYHRHFLRFLFAYLGISTLPAGRGLYTGAENFGDWVTETFQIDRRTYRDIKLAYRQGAQKRSMPWFSGARELTIAIRVWDADLWLTTSRPYLRLDNVDPDTRAWLDRHHIEYDHLLYDEDKYSVLATQVDPARVVAVLDDLPSMYDAAAAVFGEAVPILNKTPWNSAVRRPNDVFDLSMARALIRDRIRAWKGALTHTGELP